MTKTSLLSKAVVLGATLLGSLSLTTSASAITIQRVTPAPNWTNLRWKVEGRAGADPNPPVNSSQDDYELAIGPNGAQSDLVTQQDWVWDNGQDVDWSLNWDSSTVSFQFGNLASISYQPTTSTNVFNGFYLLTKSQVQIRANDPNSYVDPDTTIDFLVKTLNGESVTDQFANSIFSSATSVNTTPTLNQPFFASDVPITSLSGTVKMSWINRNPQTGNGRSFVDFQIRGFNIKDSASIPEPTSTLSLLALGTLFAIAALKRQNNQKI